jgi:hypothetical protein
MTDTIMPDLTVTFLDNVPESGNPGPSDILACETCGEPLTYGGRGRKPRFCPEHRRNKSATGTGARSGSTVALVERAVSELSSAYRLASLGISKFVDPTSGSVVAEKADALAESWRPLLETNKKLRDAFAKTESAAAYLPLIAVHGDVIVACMLARQVDRLMTTANNEHV